MRKNSVTRLQGPIAVKYQSVACNRGKSYTRLRLVTPPLASPILSAPASPKSPPLIYCTPLATQRPDVVSSTRMRRGHHSGLSGAGAGIFPQWGILKNNRKESIHETRWQASRRRAPSWIPERRHGGYAGGAVGIAGRAGSCRYRGIGRHRAERHQRRGAGISGLCDTRSNAWAAKGGTTRGTIARHTRRSVERVHARKLAIGVSKDPVSLRWEIIGVMTGKRAA